MIPSAMIDDLIDEAVSEAVDENTRKLAQNMLDYGDSVEKVSAITGIPQAELLKHQNSK